MLGARPLPVGGAAVRRPARRAPTIASVSDAMRAGARGAVAREPLDAFGLVGAVRDAAAFRLSELQRRRRRRVGWSSSPARRRCRRDAPSRWRWRGSPSRRSACSTSTSPAASSRAAAGLGSIPPSRTGGPVQRPSRLGATGRRRRLRPRRRRPAPARPRLARPRGRSAPSWRAPPAVTPPPCRRHRPRQPARRSSCSAMRRSSWSPLGRWPSSWRRPPSTSRSSTAWSAAPCPCGCACRACACATSRCSGCAAAAHGLRIEARLPYRTREDASLGGGLRRPARVEAA